MTPEEREEINKIFLNFVLNTTENIDTYTRSVKLISDKNTKETMDKIDGIMADLRDNIIKKVETKFVDIEARLWNLERRV